MAERIVALVDPDPRMRAATRERMVQVGWRDALAGVREFFDYRELYAKMGDALDAVFIATPNHHHALAAVLAMRRGIHVFVEKPMASTVAEAQEIRKAKNFSYKTTEHTHEFYAAIRESRPANTGFDYSVPLAETLLLANVAARAGKGAVLKWDGRSITNNPAANAFLSAPCRPGWELG